MADAPELQRIAFLEGQVAALEAALERRSRCLRTLQKHLAKRDLVRLHRLDAGLSDLPVTPFDPEFWEETPVQRQADVEETLLALWSALTAATRAGREGS